jgi:hypothetical protein
MLATYASSQHHSGRSVFINMAEPTIQDLFGAGATQTATTITILKSDLTMTASASNRGEQVFAAIVKKAAPALADTTFGTNADQSISIESGYDAIVTRTFNSVQSNYLRTQLNLNFHKLQATSGITPDDY